MSATQAALELVPASNRQAWRLHHVEAGDTLDTIAKSYHLAAERIVAVNRAADSLEAGDTLLIPAVFHEDAPNVRVRASSSRARSSVGSRSTHIAASRRVPAQVLHRRATVRTASLQ